MKTNKINPIIDVHILSSDDYIETIDIRNIIYISRIDHLGNYAVHLISGFILKLSENITSRKNLVNTWKEYNK